jgi:hypothetical protein
VVRDNGSSHLGIGQESWEPLISRRQIERIPIESTAPSILPDLGVPLVQLSATLSWPSKNRLKPSEMSRINCWVPREMARVVGVSGMGQVVKQQAAQHHHGAHPGDRMEGLGVWNQPGRGPCLGRILQPKA